MRQPPISAIVSPPPTWWPTLSPGAPPSHLPWSTLSPLQAGQLLQYTSTKTYSKTFIIGKILQSRDLGPGQKHNGQVLQLEYIVKLNVQLQQTQMV